MVGTSIDFAEDPDIEEEVINYFSEFKSLKKYELSKEDGINEDDIQIIERVRDALIEVFGYEFFKLLITGVMTIYLTPSGEYKLYFKNHNTKDLQERLQDFGLLSVKDKLYSRLITGGGRNRIASYSGSIIYWTASLLIGSRLKLSKTDTLDIIPPSPLLGKLFENTHNLFDIKGMGVQDIVKYNIKLLEKFYNDYFKELVPPLSLVSSAYWGNEQLVLEGPQVLAKIMRNAFEESGIEDKLLDEYPELRGKEEDVKKVATAYMLRNFIQGLYSYTTRYKDQLIKALIQGEGFITIGYKLSGKGTTNPVFLIDEKANYQGYKVQIPVEKFTNEVKAKLIWSLMMSDAQLHNLKNSRSFPLISSIKHEIKEPIKHIYKELYTALEKYNEEGYYVSKDGKEKKGTFEVNFYNPTTAGFAGPPRKRITLNPSDPSYKNKLASVVSLMVKKMYTIVIKQEYDHGDLINVLYADLFGLLDESYIKLNFFSSQISGTLHNKYYDEYYGDDENRVQWEDSEWYGDLKEEDGYNKGAFTLKNSYPLWRFVETEEYTYNKIIARIFNEAAREDNVYPQLKPDDLP